MSKKKSKDKQAKALKRIKRQLAQLSDRHAGAIRKIGKLEQRIEEQMEQLSARHAASVKKLKALEKYVA